MGSAITMISILDGTVPLSDFHTVATSPDGITWTQRPLDTLGSLGSIAFGNGRFVAVGSGGDPYQKRLKCQSVGLTLFHFSLLNKGAVSNSPPRREDAKTFTT